MEGWEWCLALAWVVCSFWLRGCPRLYLDVVLSVTSVVQYGGGDQREPKFSSCSISPLSALLLELISSTADISVCIPIFKFLSLSVDSSSSSSSSNSNINIESMKAACGAWRSLGWCVRFGWEWCVGGGRAGGSGETCWSACGPRRAPRLPTSRPAALSSPRQFGKILRYLPHWTRPCGRCCGDGRESAPGDTGRGGLMWTLDH
jgi:hypothetical protein